MTISVCSQPLPSLSLVVVAFDMARELPRTLHTLSPSYQRCGSTLQYEVVVVDNGSPASVDIPDDAHFRLIGVDSPSPSPARAANQGIASSSGELIGLLIDGARLATPGLMLQAARASRLHERPVISVHGFHLGEKPQMESMRGGYDQDTEDELLDRVPWRTDGYQLFKIAVFGGSSKAGWFAPMAESQPLFLTKGMWQELGGLDERFTSRGGGLVALDAYERAIALPGAEVIVLLGEATFHQFHGGVATNALVSPWPEFAAEYRQLRGRDYVPPTPDARFFGITP